MHALLGKRMQLTNGVGPIGFLRADYDRGVAIDQKGLPHLVQLSNQSILGVLDKDADFDAAVKKG